MYMGGNRLLMLLNLPVYWGRIILVVLGFDGFLVVCCRGSGRSGESPGGLLAIFLVVCWCSPGHLLVVPVVPVVFSS